MLHLTVATALEFALNPIAFESGYFKVYPTELHNVPYPKLLQLQLWTKMFQDLINTAFFPYDQPHRPFKVYIVLFILLSKSLLLTVINSLLNDAGAFIGWNLPEIVCVNRGPIKAPECALLMLVKESEDEPVRVVGIMLHLVNIFALNTQCVPKHVHIVGGPMLWLVSVVNHASFSVGRGAKCKLLIIVLLLLVHIEVGTIKIKKTVRQLIARECAQDECRVVLSIAGDLWQEVTPAS